MENSESLVIVTAESGKRYLIDRNFEGPFNEGEEVFDRENYLFPEYEEKGIHGEVGKLKGWGRDTGWAFIELVNGKESISDSYYRIIREVSEEV